MIDPLIDWNEALYQYARDRFPRETARLYEHVRAGEPWPRVEARVMYSRRYIPPEFMIAVERVYQYMHDHMSDPLFTEGGR
jgi:hypothetical protein